MNSQRKLICFIYPLLCQKVLGLVFLNVKKENEKKIVKPNFHIHRKVLENCWENEKNL